MIRQLEDLIRELGAKPTWSAKELIPKIQSTSQLLADQLKDGGQLVNMTSAKKIKVSSIRKYDIVYVGVIGIPHYFLVHKVVDQVVYGVVFTSSHKPAFCIHEVKEDRSMEGSFVTNAYLSIDLDVAMESFIRIFESKREADEIFRKISTHYLTLFKK
jgi:hypothetical protein